MYYRRDLALPIPPLPLEPSLVADAGRSNGERGTAYDRNWYCSYGSRSVKILRVAGRLWRRGSVAYVALFCNCCPEITYPIRTCEQHAEEHSSPSHFPDFSPRRELSRLLPVKRTAPLGFLTPPSKLLTVLIASLAGKFENVM